MTRAGMGTIFEELHYAQRTLFRTPLFTSIVVLTLAIGIGATTAVFSVVDRVLFRSLPYANADRLVSWGLTGPIDDNEFMLGQNYLEWRDRLPPFQSVTSLSPWLEGDLGDRDPIRVRCIPVEANLLTTLGVKPALGRDFTRKDDVPNAPRVALVSYGLWKSRFGGRAAALNQITILDDQPTRIVGVLPKDFELPVLGRADILIPQQTHGTMQFLRAFARLKPDISIERARQELQPIFKDTLRSVPSSLRKEIGLKVRSMRDRQVGEARLASWMLLGAVLALLLIACANVANLLLARAAVKERELAMRWALGAGRWRLARQALVESGVLAACGALIGCAFAWTLLRIISRLAPEGLLQLDQAKINPRVLLFTLGASIVTALLFGFFPAVERPRPEALTGWHAAGTRRTFLRRALVAIQIAVSLVLLTGASLFMRSLWNIERQQLGLEPNHAVTVSFELNHHRYDTAGKLTSFYNQLQAKLTEIPGVNGFALSDSLPPGGWIHSRPFSNMAIVGQEPLASEGGMVLFRYVTPDYFKVLRIPIVEGRAFDEGDRSPSQNSIIVNAKLAQRLFGNHNALGHEIIVDPQQPPLTVVGVVANVKNNGLANAASPEYYRARKRSQEASLGVRAVAIIRSSASVTALAPWIRAQVASLDPHLPVAIETMRDRVDEQNERPRFVTVLVALFATFGLALAAVGLYGLMAFVVTQQTREIGIRMALGATAGDVTSSVLRQAGTWTAAGALCGIVCSLALLRLVRGLLFEVSPYDPFSTAIAIAVLCVTALAASWRPSRRASKVDPAVSLRYE